MNICISNTAPPSDKRNFLSSLWCFCHSPPAEGVYSPFFLNSPLQLCNFKFTSQWLVPALPLVYCSQAQTTKGRKFPKSYSSSLLYGLMGWLDSWLVFLIVNAKMFPPLHHGMNKQSNQLARQIIWLGVSFLLSRPWHAPWRDDPLWNW